MNLSPFFKELAGFLQGEGKDPSLEELPEGDRPALHGFQAEMQFGVLVEKKALFREHLIAATQPVDGGSPAPHDTALATHLLSASHHPPGTWQCSEA